MQHVDPAVLWRHGALVREGRLNLQRQGGPGRRRGHCRAGSKGPQLQHRLRVRAFPAPRCPSSRPLLTRPVPPRSEKLADAPGNIVLAFGGKNNVRFMNDVRAYSTSTSLMTCPRIAFEDSRARRPACHGPPQVFNLNSSSAHVLDSGVPGNGQRCYQRVTTSSPTEVPTVDLVKLDVLARYGCQNRFRLLDVPAAAADPEAEGTLLLDTCRDKPDGESVEGAFDRAGVPRCGRKVSASAPGRDLLLILEINGEGLPHSRAATPPRPTLRCVRAIRRVLSRLWRVPGHRTAGRGAHPRQRHPVHQLLRCSGHIPPRPHGPLRAQQRCGANALREVRPPQPATQGTACASFRGALIPVRPGALPIRAFPASLCLVWLPVSWSVC